MDITKWDTEEAKEVWFEEGYELGVKLGHVANPETEVRLLLAENLSISVIQKITGLDIQTIKSLRYPSN